MMSKKILVHYSQISSGNALASVNFDSLQDIVKVSSHNSSKKQQQLLGCKYRQTATFPLRMLLTLDVQPFFPRSVVQYVQKSDIV